MRSSLARWVQSALSRRGGTATIAQVCEDIWRRHEDELRNSGDHFYTWQYEVRWAADHLRRKGVMKPAQQSPRGMWELAAGVSTLAKT